MVQFAVSLPPAFRDTVAVMTAFPALTPFTTPSAVTVATAVLPLFQVIFPFCSVVGVIIPFRVKVLPMGMVRAAALRERVGAVTVIVQVALRPLAVVAEMAAVPVATAVTLPPDTVATSALLVDQVTDLLVVLVGSTVGERERVSPSVSCSVVTFSETEVGKIVTLPSVKFAVMVTGLSGRENKMI